MIIPRFSEFRYIFSCDASGTPGVPNPLTGLEAWPVSRMQAVLPSGLVVPNPLSGANIILTANNLTPDAVAGVDEWDWYLSQRSDDPAKQMLRQLSVSPAGGLRMSGSIGILYSSLCTATYGATPDATSVAAIFRDVYLYLRRRSDAAVWMIDFMRSTVV